MRRKKTLFFSAMLLSTMVLFSHCQKDEIPIQAGTGNIIQSNSESIFSIEYDMTISSYQEPVEGAETPDNVKFRMQNRAVPIIEKNHVFLEVYEDGKSKLQIDEISSEQRFPTETHITKTVINNGYISCYSADNELMVQQDFTGQLPDFGNIVKTVQNGGSVPTNQILSKTLGDGWGDFETIEDFVNYLEDEYGASINYDEETMVIQYNLPTPISSGQATGDVIKLFVNVEEQTVGTIIIYDSNLNILISGTKINYEFQESLYIPVTIISITRTEIGGIETIGTGINPETNIFTTYTHTQRSIDNLEVTSN